MRPTETQGDAVHAGIFADEKAAAAAVHALEEIGFDPTDEITVIQAHQRQHEEVRVPFTIHADTGAWIGAPVGIVAGALLGLMQATGMIALTDAGPILAVAQGAFIGGAVGFLIGLLAGLAYYKEEARFDGAQVRGGAVWVGVRAHGERARLAVDALRRAGARHLQLP